MVHAPESVGFGKRGHVSASGGGSWALLHDHASLFRTTVLLAAGSADQQRAFLYCLALAANVLRELPHAEFARRLHERFAAVEREDAYREARAAFLAGTNACFPAGTVWLKRRAGVACEPFATD